MARMFEDQLVPETPAGHPPWWEIQQQCIETHDFSPTSEEWKNCDKLIKQSLPSTITMKAPRCRMLGVMMLINVALKKSGGYMVCRCVKYNETYIIC